LRKKGPADHPCVRKLEALLAGNEDLVLTGVILQEVLQAFKSESTFRRLIEYFEPFPLLELGRSDYVSAAKLHRRCASRGISVSTADCQIAIACINHDCALLTADKDFERIAQTSVLKLV
jgi:predicted nucleic acid-binding protein